MDDFIVGALLVIGDLQTNRTQNVDGFIVGAPALRAHQLTISLLGLLFSSPRDVQNELKTLTGSLLGFLFKGGKIDDFIVGGCCCHR